MLDQSHNVTDPIESLITSAAEVQRSYLQALCVDRDKLESYQQDNDVMLASQCLKNGFRTDVEPILAMARYELGGAIDPIAAYRASGYRYRKAQERPASGTGGSGIV